MEPIVNYFRCSEGCRRSVAQSGFPYPFIIYLMRAF